MLIGNGNPTPWHGHCMVIALIISSPQGDACPKQNNGSDCGMFATKFADYRSRDLALDFGQRNMQYFRCRTAWEIFQGKCLA